MTKFSKRAEEYFEDICMNSLNQAIGVLIFLKGKFEGRSIRHVADYAIVVTVDRRFQRQNIKNKLPNWMKPSIPIDLERTKWNSGTFNSFYCLLLFLQERFN